MKSARDFTLQKLKDKLTALRMDSAGTKAELFTRLMEHDPSGGWMGDAEEESHETRATGDDSYVANTTNALQAQYERELNLMRREAALRERELALARREIEMLRETQQRGHVEDERVEATSVASESTSSQVQSRVSISAIADLLGQFEGAANHMRDGRNKCDC